MARTEQAVSAVDERAAGEGKAIKGKRVVTVPRAFTPKPEATGELPVKVNKRKYRATCVLYPNGIAEAPETVVIVRKGDVDEDGEPLVLNESAFRTSPEGYLLLGHDTVAAVESLEAWRKRRAYEETKAQAALRSVVGLSQARAEMRKTGIPLDRDSTLEVIRPQHQAQKHAAHPEDESVRTGDEPEGDAAE